MYARACDLRMERRDRERRLQAPMCRRCMRLVLFEGRGQGERIERGLENYEKEVKGE